MFLAILILLLFVSLVVLSYPFWRGESQRDLVGEEATEDQERLDLEIEKRRLMDTLSELEVERDQVRWSPENYERLKARDEHRLVQVLERLDRLNKERRQHGLKAAHVSSSVFSWAAPLVLGVVVAGGAGGVYNYLDWRQNQVIAAMQAPAQPPEGMPNPLEMVARLEARLKENPDDLEGQIMAGRSYMALGRFDDAQNAWSKVLEMDPRNHEAHFHVGALMLQQRDANDPQIFEKALSHFEAALLRVPREPAVLWYKGLALVHLKRYSEADESWTQAYQNLMPGSEDAEFVKKALQDLRAGKPLEF